MFDISLDFSLFSSPEKSAEGGMQVAVGSAMRSDLLLVIAVNLLFLQLESDKRGVSRSDTDVGPDKSGCSVKVVRLRSQVRNESVRRSSSILPVCERQSQCSYKNAQYSHKECDFHRENPIERYLNG